MVLGGPNEVIEDVLLAAVIDVRRPAGRRGSRHGGGRCDAFAPSPFGAN